jgi:AraC family transcriptional regulator
MDWLDKMNAAMEYIENHLEDDIDYQEIARKARCSEYHFRRMFPFITGVSLSEYIRQRRFTLAVSDLRDTSKPVFEIAKKYGYDSPDSFTRSFKNLHGITPSEVQKGGQPVKAYPRMTFHLSIKGGTEMTYRIEEKQAFHIAGMMKRVHIQFEGENTEVAEMWKSLEAETIQKLKSFSNTKPSGLIQASTNFDDGRMEEKGGLDHYIGVATTKNDAPGFTILDVPKSAWAVFEIEDSSTEKIQNTWGRIYSEWFPESDYELSEGPEILWAEQNGNPSSTDKAEIWIPVKKTGK